MPKLPSRSLASPVGRSGGLRAGKGDLGARTLGDLRATAKFVRVSPAAIHESHPHGVLITRESPNYPGNV